MISADSHLEIPPTEWIRYVPAHYRDSAPVVVTINGDEAVQVPGNMPIFNATNLTGGRPVKMRGVSYWEVDGSPAPGSGRPAQRLLEQDKDGLTAEVLYPPLFMGRCIEGVEDKDAYVAMVSAYNEYLAEYCSYEPDRLIGVGVIPKTGIEDALLELKRIQGFGLRAVVLRWFPSGSGNPTYQDNAFWEAVLTMGMRVTAHTEMGGPPRPLQRLAIPLMSVGPEGPMPLPMGSPPLPDFVTLAGRANTSIPITLGQFMCGQVLDVFPELVVYLAEVNAGWLPNALAMMDDSYSLYRECAGINLQMLPSEYALRHFRFGIVRDSLALESTIPAKNLMWGSDFPHAVGSFPHSLKWLDGHMARRSLGERDLITRGNAVEFFGMRP